jgi:phosphatidylinositol-bisphosphatase
LGSDTFDSSEKKRPPAFCDRVLWKAPPSRAVCTEYHRHDNRTSDHRPVSALITVQVAVPDEAARQRVRSEIARSLDAWENSCVPTATLSEADFDFGELVFGEPARRSMTLVNSGQTALKFSFEPLPDTAGGVAMPSWIDVHPMSNLLMPGEECTIHVTGVSLVTWPAVARL